MPPLPMLPFLAISHSWRNRRVIAVVLGFVFGVSTAAAALPLDPPEQFFTNVAERLLQQQLGMGLTQIQIAPTNEYGSAVHRVFQVTANIYDAANTNEFPTVFRPLFEIRSNGVFLAGFTNDNNASTVDAWIESNPYGIPMVIGAKKGMPNFNEFVLRSDFLVSRRIQLTRPSTAPWTRPDGTNQMYVLGISNYFGVEMWNSYDVGRAGPYPRPVSITVSNRAAMSLTNNLGLQTNSEFRGASITNLPSGSWRGGETFGFILPFNTNAVSLSNAVYRFSQNDFANVSTNAFETLSAFPLPYWVFSISNRLTCLMADENKIIDFVVLTDDRSVDLYRDLIGTNPYERIAGGTTATLSRLWSTNRVRGPNGPTDGLLQQLDIALGHIPTANADWRAYALTTGTENDKNAAINTFRNFCGLSPISPIPFPTNTTLAIQSPFNPAARLAVFSTWQANDPLVHYHITDLRLGGAPTNHQYLRPSQPSTNIYPSSLGRLNDLYSPWGGNPHKSSDPNQFNRTLKDPGVYSSDDWKFPAGQFPGIGWLGHVHRGTPWQTIYLKSDAAGLWGPNGWTNQSFDLVVDPDGRQFSRTHPTNDWRMVALLAALLNTNDVRGLMSVNTTNLGFWSTTLAGLNVLSNDLESPHLLQPPSFETDVIEAGDPQISTIVDGIHRTRIAQRGQYFTDVAAFFSVPELSSTSPWLNLTGNQPQYGLTDEAYEILPSQLLSLVRGDPVGTVTRSGDSIELRFTVFDGYAYRVEGSANLATWTTVSEPHYPTNAVFTLALPASSDPQFFRAVLLP